jgi:hypothetical protein
MNDDGIHFSDGSDQPNNYGVGFPDPGMIASETGMRARDPWEMERPRPRLPFTVSACSECAKLVGFQYCERIGGNVEGAPCQLCGKVAILGEWRTGVTAADIRDDMK